MKILLLLFCVISLQAEFIMSGPVSEFIFEPLKITGFTPEVFALPLIKHNCSTKEIILLTGLETGRLFYLQNAKEIDQIGTDWKSLDENSRNRLNLLLSSLLKNSSEMLLNAENYQSEGALVSEKALLSLGESLKRNISFLNQCISMFRQDTAVSEGFYQSAQAVFENIDQTVIALYKE